MAKNNKQHADNVDLDALDESSNKKKSGDATVDGLNKDGTSTKSRMTISDDDDDDTDKNSKDNSNDSFIDRIRSMRVTDLAALVGIPAAVMLITGTLTGAALSGSNEPVQQAAPKPVESVEGARAILDKAESIKDNQIVSLRKQMSTMKVQGESGLTVEEMKALTTISDDAVKVLDPFFTELSGIRRDANTAEMSSIQGSMKDYMTPSASTSVLYNVISGNSPARQLNTNITKSGIIKASWIGSNTDDERVYVVYVPFVAESGNYEAVYTTSLDKNGKISNVEYNGLLVDGKNSIDDTLAKQLTEPSKDEQSASSSAPQPSEQAPAQPEGDSEQDPAQDMDPNAIREGMISENESNVDPDMDPNAIREGMINDGGA